MQIMINEEVIHANFVQEMIQTTSNMYRLGWDERNGGNISYLLSEEEVSQYINPDRVTRKIDLTFNCSEIAGKYFIVTGSGKYFKNIKDSPEESLGVVRISETGQQLEILWGFENDGLPTSELPTHLMSHIARLQIDSSNRVVIHCHASHLLAMTYSHVLDEKAFTKTLWKMSTECLVVFPEGVGIIPWIVPGTEKIGNATSEKIKNTRLVIWPFHGVYGAGSSLDDAFGLIETAEKAAMVYTFASAQGGIKQKISDDELKQLAQGFNVTPRKGYLES